MISRDGPFLFRILIWCQVPLENLTVRFDPLFLVHVEKIFSSKNLETHNPIVKTPSINYYNFCIGTEFCSICLKSSHLRCLILLRVFLPRRPSWPSNLVRERTTVLFVSDLRHGFPTLVHD